MRRKRRKKSNKKRQKWGNYLFCLVLILIGIRGFYWVAHDTWLAVKSLSWHQTEGVVTSARVDRSLGSRGPCEEAEKKLSLYPVNSRVSIFLQSKQAASVLS